MKDIVIADKPEEEIILVDKGDGFKLQKKPEIVYDGNVTLTEKLLEENGKKYVSITFYATPFLTSPNKYFEAFKNIFDGGRLELSYPKQKIELAGNERDEKYCLNEMFPFEFRGKLVGQDVKGRIGAKYMSDGDSVRIDIEYEDMANKSLLRSIRKMLLKIEPDTFYFNKRMGYETWQSLTSPKKEEPDIFGMNPRNFDGIKLPIRCR